MTYGRTYSEQRFSPLAQITADNVSLLGLAWYADFDVDRGQEASPLIIDGVMYVSTRVEHRKVPHSVSRTQDRR
jgi:glucose dehydrogenase